MNKRQKFELSYLQSKDSKGGVPFSIRELGSTRKYIKGAWEQAKTFRDLEVFFFFFLLQTVCLSFIINIIYGFLFLLQTCTHNQ